MDYTKERILKEGVFGVSHKQDPEEVTMGDQSAHQGAEVKVDFFDPDMARRFYEECVERFSVVVED